MVRTPDKAIEAAYKQSNSNKPFRAGTCLMQCRTAYKIGAKYGDAATAWRNAKYKHETTSVSEPPKGALVFWTGGSQGYGHIAISTGGGHCWSTDIERRGYFNHVPIADIGGKWHMKYVGWTEDVNDVRVLKPATRWSKLRPQLIALLTSPDMNAVCQRRPAVRAWRSVTLAGLNRLSKT